MAIVSQPPRRLRTAFGRPLPPGAPRPRGRYVIAAAVALVVIVLGALAAALAFSSGTLTTDPQALASVGMPFGGGSVQSPTAVIGRDDRPLPIVLRDGRIWPTRTIRAGERVSVDVVIKRPGAVAWLTGSTEHLRLSFTAPSSALAQSYLTLSSGAPITVHFTHPVRVIWSGAALGQMHRSVLGAPVSEVNLPRSASAGSMWVAGAPRNWETARAATLSWFPAGAATAAVANPAPGSTIKPSTPIVLTFSKSVSQALGSSLPPVSPVTSGAWHALNSHTIVFRPLAYGYGLGAHVTVGLPAGVQLVGGHASGSSDVGSWNVPAGSTVRLQQLLATLGYLPLRFNHSGAPVPKNPLAQENAAIHPPTGTFTWRYPNVPGELRNLWAPGAFGELTKGAIMAFENTEGMTADGVPGPQVWRALITATLHQQSNGFGYTFVQVNEGSPETESTWHNGKTVVSGVVNTGIPADPTAQGVFAVFEHATSVTMSGTNPDGSHYDDPGVPYVSYFNGGDALHGFLRASYGFAQSLGCVEMPYSEAAAVYPYTPIGTIVDVS